MDTIKISDDDFKEMVRYKFPNSYESSAYLIIIDNKKYVLKLFNENINTKSKFEKIILLKDRLKDTDLVVTADSFATYKDKKGYIMPYIDGKEFDYVGMRKKNIISVLKLVSQSLKEIHKYNIVCGDFTHNFIIGNDNKLHFIDHDNYQIDDRPVDTPDIFLRNYMKYITNIDSNYDNYVLNLYTVAALYKIFYPYIIECYRHKDIEFKDKEINQILENTFNLKDSYDEKAIVDLIKEKKDLRRLRHY